MERREREFPCRLVRNIGTLDLYAVNQVTVPEGL
jgi:hypothetical protein